MQTTIDFETPLKKQRRIWKITRFFLKFFYNFEIKGVENLNKLPPNYGVIFASVHIGLLDVIFTPASLPYHSKLLPIFYIIRIAQRYKNKLIKWILGSKYISTWGAHPALSHGFLAENYLAYEKALKIHLKILENRGSVIIYPEARIRYGKYAKMKKGKLKAQPGVAFLASTTECPVVPIFIQNKHKGFGKLIPFVDEVKIIFGEPLFFEDLFPGDYRNSGQFENLKEISKKIVEEIDKLNPNNLKN